VDTRGSPFFVHERMVSTWNPVASAASFMVRQESTAGVSLAIGSPISPNRMIVGPSLTDMATQVDPVGSGPALVGMLLGQLDVPVALPARPWPVVGACEVLARRLPASSWERDVARGACRYPGSDATVEGWLVALARDGAVTTRGRGSLAVWAVDEDWRQSWTALAWLLEDDVRATWLAAADVLHRSLSIAAKIAAAAASGAAESTSST
jgi:hypothetical protein